jgi:Na+/H+ antiporter NhaD/arsenite permease-like protein
MTFMKETKLCLATLLALLPGLAMAEAELAKPLNLTSHWVGYFSVAVLVIAYVAAMLEEATELRKSKPVLFASALIWFAVAFVYKQQGDTTLAVKAFSDNLLAYSELLLFIIVSMTYLNTMEKQQIFAALRVWLVSKRFSFRQLFWITGILVFFISTACNGLTAALLMGTVVVAVGKHNPRFASLACINIVVATNAGGTFSPVGGISTLFVWQRGIIEFTEFFTLFVPCLINFLIPAICMHFAIPKETPSVEVEIVDLQRGAKRTLFLFGVTIFMAIAVDMYLHLPPAAGMMAGLSMLQLFTFYLKKTQTHFIEHNHPQRRTGDKKQSDIFDSIGHLDWDTLFFFYGAMMGIGGIGFLGYLDGISEILYGQFSPTTANILIGLSSAFVDNGTLMFAVLNMHPNITHGEWLLVTLTLGVGGSLLAIGSAPGVGLMGQAKGLYTFSAHMKWMPVILLSYFVSIGVHLLLNANSF